jgi:hypothetical protein
MTECVNVTMSFGCASLVLQGCWYRAVRCSGRSAGARRRWSWILRHKVEWYRIVCMICVLS